MTGSTVTVTGVAAISAYGTGWRGIAAAVASGATLIGVPAERPLANPRARKMMSRGAYLAAACLGELLGEVGWTSERDRIGYFLGVGASGGSLDDVTALLDASIADGTFSLTRFGDRGLAACNPLLAFQLMNNFTLCHGAILDGLGGPCSALFSRGAGTTAALVEAVHAVRTGDCERALAGGADAATNPVTIAELCREGFVARGLRPADGAALVALSSDPVGAIAVVEGAAIASGRGRPVHAALDEAIARSGVSSVEDSERVVIAPWGPPAADALRSWAHVHAPRATVIDTGVLGDTQAAGHALAWAVACDRIAGTAQRALVLGLGVDGDVGVAAFRGGAA